MPQNTDHSRLRNVESKPKAEGPTKRVIERVVYDHPPLRAATLPEASYIHRARPKAEALDGKQTWAIAAHKRGERLPVIAQSTGLSLATLMKTLGLSEEEDRQAVEELRAWYANRRNP